MEISKKTKEAAATVIRNLILFHRIKFSYKLDYLHMQNVLPDEIYVLIVFYILKLQRKLFESIL